MSKVYKILEAIKKKLPLLQVIIRDPLGQGMIMFLIEEEDPENLFEKKSFMVENGSAIRRTQKQKEPELITSRKKVEYIIQSSLVLNETHYPVENIMQIDVVRNEELLQSILTDCQPLIDKVESGDIAG